MEQNTDHGIVWYLCIAQQYTAALAAIRHWGNLYLGREDELVWVKGFDAVQIQSAEVLCLPFAGIYYTRGVQLVKQGSLLPDRDIPQTGWTGIAAALPLDRPLYNHNYFGVQAALQVGVQPEDEEKQAAALMVPIAVLDDYITTAPAHRLQNLAWCITDAEYAIITGSPVLPLPGTAFWQEGRAYFPLGYRFNMPALAQQVYCMLCPQQDAFLFWQQDGSYFRIPENDFQPLSRGSYRNTLTL